MRKTININDQLFVIATHPCKAELTHQNPWTQAVILILPWPFTIALKTKLDQLVQSVEHEIKLGTGPT